MGMVARRRLGDHWDDGFGRLWGVVGLAGSWGDGFGRLWDCRWAGCAGRLWGDGLGDNWATTGTMTSADYGVMAWRQLGDYRNDDLGRLWGWSLDGIHHQIMEMVGLAIAGMMASAVMRHAHMHPKKKCTDFKLRSRPPAGPSGRASAMCRCACRMNICWGVGAVARGAAWGQWCGGTAG